MPAFFPLALRKKSFNPEAVVSNPVVPFALATVWALASAPPPSGAQHPGNRNPDEVAEELGKSPIYQRYLAMRDDADPDDAAAHAGIAGWASRNSLPFEARAHGVVAAALDTKNDAYQRLAGRVRRGNTWATDAEHREMFNDLDLARRTTARWNDRLRAVRPAVQKGNVEPLYKLAADLQTPLAIPALERFGTANGENAQHVVISAVSRLNHQEATDALIRHALLAESEAVRRHAASKLAARNPVYYVPRLVEYLSDGTVDARTVLMPFGGTGGRHAVAWAVTVGGRTEVEKFDVNGDLERAAVLLQQARGGGDWPEIQARQRSDRAVAALEEATGQKLGNNPVAWREWLADLTDSYLPEAAKNPPPRVIETLAGSISAPPPIPVGIDCFAKGTPVWTRRGMVAIDRVRPGDLVYSRDMDTGRVNLQPVVRTTARPATKLAAVTVGGETVVATLGHPFRVRGRAWVMARDLKVGDQVKTAAGYRPVDGVEPRPAAPAYCLELADQNTFYVTAAKVLVHDNAPVYDLELDPAATDEK
jgi:hypothetical protein